MLLPEYFGIFGSILSAHALIPPVRFFTLVKPAWRRKSTALALRTECKKEGAEDRQREPSEARARVRDPPR